MKSMILSIIVALVALSGCSSNASCDGIEMNWICSDNKNTDIQCSETNISASAEARR